MFRVKLYGCSIIRLLPGGQQRMSEKPAGMVFINYRRGDASAVAGRLRDWLEEGFGRAGLFLGTYDIPASADFVSVIEQRMAECDALLVVISETWLDTPDGNGGRQLDDPDDVVRIEIASALRQGKRVIPVLVNGAQMPSAERLPESLKPLAYCDALRLSCEHVIADMEELTTELRMALAEAAADRAARSEVEWAAAAGGRRARASGGNARAVQFEDATAWPTLAEIHKAGEPAEWEILKDRPDVREFRNRLAGFDGNAIDGYASTKLEALLPHNPETHGEIASWRAFLSEFPDDIDVEAARERLQALEHHAKAAANASELSETEAWARATSSGSIEEIQAFLNEWPAGEYQDEAREWLRALELAAKAAWAAEAKKLNETRTWTKAASSGSIAEIKAFLTEWPSGEHAELARARLRGLEQEAEAAWAAKAQKANETKAWASIADTQSIEEIKAFLKEYPASEHTEEARARIKELRGPVVSRRSVFMGLGIGAAVAVVGGGIMYVARTPAGKLPPSIYDRPLRTFTGHTAWVHSVAFSPDGRTILSGDSKTLILWDVATGKALRKFTGAKDDIRSAAFSPDGSTVLSGDGGGELKLWDTDTGEVLHSLRRHSDGIPSVAFSPDGATVLSGSFDGTLKLSDIATGKELRTFKGHKRDVNSAVFSPDGRTVLSASRDRTLKLWDIAAGRELRTFAGHADWVGAAIFSPDGRTALSSSTDKTLRLWDISIAQELRSFSGHARDFSPVTFSPDGRTVLSGGYITLKLWDIATGRELRTLTGHADGVTAIAISPDGGTAVSGSVDTTLKLWDLTPHTKSR